MEGVIQLGKLKRIQAVLYYLLFDKKLNNDAEFD